MRVIVASDSFKGSLRSLAVGQAVETGLRRVYPDAQVQILPIADGGEGTVEALVTASGGQYRTVMVTSPLGEPVAAVYGFLPDGSAVMEMAAASGLPLVPLSRRNPRLTTTLGTGEMMRRAADEGAQAILLGIGGSATNDGGMGMAKALGVRFLDRKGRELPLGGGALAQLAHIDMTGFDRRFEDLPVTVICDVTNPLCGEAGASAIYGPQKGATAADVEFLDGALAHYADVLWNDLGCDVRDIPGAGAAGGLGAGLLSFTNAVLRPGTQAVLDVLRFDEALQDVDLVITGEGRIDGQSVCGKVPQGVAARAKVQGKPVIAIVGSVEQGAEILYREGLSAIVPIVNRPMELSEAMAEASALTADAAERVFRIWQASRK